MNHARLLLALTLPAVLCGATVAAADAFAPATRPATTQPVVLGRLDAARFFTDRPDPKPLPVPEETDAFSFVVYGDRTGGPVEGVQVLADAVRDTNLLGPDLVMTVGDLVEGYNEQPQWGEQANEYKGIMDRLRCPWFPVPGNHDVYWRDKNKSGDARPAGENEGLYERAFGPLWYAFEHKNSWFVVLYSDEGDPATGEMTFHKAASQRMSPEQFAWLDKTLTKAKDADHVFVFLHHPRWHGERTGAEYGDDWERVHQRLAAAGNVAAVFAGHIHHMTYAGPRDGIEYFALATVGGEQSGLVPRAGFLHHYNVVTVRKGGIATTTIPVGAAFDPRALTLEVVEAAQALARLAPQVSPKVTLASDGSAEGVVRVTLTNPTAYAAQVTLTPTSRDSHWLFSPDHDHALLAPGGSRTVELAVRRLPGAADASMDLASLAVESELLTDAARIPIPPATTTIPADLTAMRGATPPERAVALDGTSGYVPVASADVPLPDGPMTLEAWMRAESLDGRIGLVSKAQSSDYGIFVTNGTPAFMAYLGDGYVAAKGPKLEVGRWYHVAGVYDGREVRLYVDGKKVSSTAGTGPRKTNDLPLIIGGDVDGSGRMTSPFHGEVDAVRLSKVARYAGDRFAPERRPRGDDDAVLLLNCDEQIGGALFDDSPAKRQIPPAGGAALADVGR